MRTSNAPKSLTPFQWENLQMQESVRIDGIPFFTRKAIGMELEYADPQKAIDNLIQRNDLIKSYSVPLSLRGTDGKKYETQVLHPIGCLMICMDSNQSKAYELKEKLAQFLYAHSFEEDTPLKDADMVKLTHLQQELMDKLTSEQDEDKQKMIYRRLIQVSLRLGDPVPPVENLYKKRKQIDLFNDQKGR